MTGHETRTQAMGLPGFLEFLSAYPPAQSVLEVLIAGPMSRFGGQFGHLWQERNGSLHPLAVVAQDPQSATVFEAQEVDADLPAALCFRESEVLVLDMAGLGMQFPPLAADEHQAAWEGFGESTRFGSAIFMPIVSRGLSLGVVGVACHEPLALGSLEISFLDGIGAALGLWLTHPSTPLEQHEVQHVPPAPRAELTERQRRIMVLVREGRSNASIAAALGFSDSTVKQEVQRTQRALHASSRATAAERAWELGLLAGQ